MWTTARRHARTGSPSNELTAAAAASTATTATAADPRGNLTSPPAGLAAALSAMKERAVRPATRSKRRSQPRTVLGASPPRAATGR